jgi:hypothetical protein
MWSHGERARRKTTVMNAECGMSNAECVTNEEDEEEGNISKGFAVDGIEE